MAIQTKTTLKSFFQTGDVPTQGNFEDLMSQYENYAIGELKKVHDLSYNSYQQRQNSNARSKKQYFNRSTINN